MHGVHGKAHLWANMDENRNLQTTFTEVSDVDVEQFAAYIKKSFHALTQTWVYYDSVCLEFRIASLMESLI